LINLNNNNSFTIESNSSFILLNSNIYNGDNILSISDGTDYQYLNTGNLKVFSVGANNDLLSLNNSNGKTITLNYNTDGYLIFDMINGTHNNSNINFTKYGAIHLTTTNYPNWSAAYKVSVPSEHVPISAFESWVGEEETFHLSCTGWLRTRSQIWSKELIVFDDSSGEDEVSFRVFSSGAIKTNSYLKSKELIVYDDASGTDYVNFHVNELGEVKARKVTVDLDSWSDFVFEDEYNLMSIPELKNFITQNKHLPDVPSEAEVTEDGVDVAEMDKILLQKIEELTLYIIELEERIDDLENKDNN